MNDVIDPSGKCPRCQVNWFKHNLLYYRCNSHCGAIIFNDLYSGTWVLSVEILVSAHKSFKISWRKDHCIVEYYKDDYYKTYIKTSIRLPILPYTISADKLKTYILFS